MTITIHQVPPEVLRSVAAEYESPSARVLPNRKGFTVLKTASDGATRCDMYVLERLPVKVKLDTLAHESLHCYGMTH